MGPHTHWVAHMYNSTMLKASWDHTFNNSSSVIWYNTENLTDIQQIPISQLGALCIHEIPSLITKILL